MGDITSPPPAKAERTLHSSVLSQILQDPGTPRFNQTTPLWQVPAHASVASLQSATLPTKADYVVIGAGITGCSVTKNLLAHPLSGSKSVVVLEARNICSGATGRNGGQLTRVPTTRYAMLVENFGVEMANKITRLTLRNLEEMKKLCETDEELQRDSRVQRLEKCFVYYDEASFREAKEALQVYEQHLPEERGVFREVSKEEAQSKYNLKDSYGAYMSPAAVCAPYRLVTNIFSRLLNQYAGRLSIEANTPVQGLVHSSTEDSTYPYLISTPRGLIRAAHVIHCTNAFASHLIPGLRGTIYPRRGTMSSQTPGSSFPDISRKQSWTFHYTPTYDSATGISETGRYYGFQNYTTRDLWIGGDREKILDIITTDDSTAAPDADKNLRQIVPTLFSSNWVKAAPEVKGLWSGFMAYTGDALPFVGRLPSKATGRKVDESSNCGEWIAAGYNTYGMANGLLCGEALVKMILGDTEGLRDWFPEAYLVTETRLSDKKFVPENVARDFMKRAGAKL